MHFCPAIIPRFLLPSARFPKWAEVPFEATGAVWAALILHRFCAAHLANLLGVKLQIEICVGKWGELYLSECKPVRSVRGQTIWRTKGSKRYKKPPHAIGGKPFKGVYLVNSLRQLRHLEQDQIVIQFHLKSLTFSLEPMSQFRQIGLEGSTNLNAGFWGESKR